jgi:hypothetical protein
VVFCELGGEGLLGKAREIADSVGDRVLALIAEDSIDPQRLIYLGADEVLKVAISNEGDWIETVCDIVRNEHETRLVIFPSNIIANVIMGAAYCRVKDKVGSFLDDAVFLDVGNATKSFQVGLGLQRTWREGLVGLVSVKIASIPEPYEDSSRYGKIREVQLAKAAEIFPILFDVPEVPLSSSSELTVLVDPESSDPIKYVARELAEKYRSKIRNYSGAVRAIYGPCIAIEINDKLAGLPEFKGDLVSMNTKFSPINAISDVSIVNPEISKVINYLL